MLIHLDIETAPCQWPGVRAEFAEAVKPPANYTKPESINAWLEANREREAEAAWLKTSLDGAMGQIICIGWAIDDGPVDSLMVDDLAPGSERDLLASWFAALQRVYSGTSGTRPMLVGHNVIGFDLPYIWKRSIVHQTRPPFWFPRDVKPWGESVADTMTMWAGVKDRISLDRLCRALGLPGKGDGPTGADVWPMWQAGRRDEIAAYCREDVERTRSVHQRLTFA